MRRNYSILVLRSNYGITPYLYIVVPTLIWTALVLFDRRDSLATHHWPAALNCALNPHPPCVLIACHTYVHMYIVLCTMYIMVYMSVSSSSINTLPVRYVYCVVPVVRHRTMRERAVFCSVLRWTVDEQYGIIILWTHVHMYYVRVLCICTMYKYICTSYLVHITMYIIPRTSYEVRGT